MGGAGPQITIISTYNVWFYITHSHLVYTVSIILTKYVGELLWLHTVEEYTVMRRMREGAFLFLFL